MMKRLATDCAGQSTWNDSTLTTEEREQPPAEQRPNALDEVDLEPFIAPVPGRMQTDDIAYLKSRGAFTLPGQKLRNALLRSYFEYVHPFMPIIDMDEFLEAMRRDGKHTRLSLLLYQAVMFAGVACVHKEYLEGLGFDSRQQARKEFFHRVRFLKPLQLASTWTYMTPFSPCDNARYAGRSGGRVMSQID
ncbi:hypothetical protein NW765_017596 [Fusarium oxysporum]|nr:hypothetical protein NW765_017596 [Fusarium oxysporum]